MEHAMELCVECSDVSGPEDWLLALLLSQKHGSTGRVCPINRNAAQVQAPHTNTGLAHRTKKQPQRWRG
jgi:hypothetical protein